MTNRIVILTPDPADEGYQTRWREVLDDQAARLGAAGLEAENRSWVDADGLESFDLILPLLCWGYHRDVSGWRAATADWESRGLNVQNPPSVLRWNSDKAYLGHLAGAGAPVVPTRFVHRVTEQALVDAAAAFGTDRLIAKPTVSASAWRTILWSPGTPLDDGPEGVALIQPFLPSVVDEGEIALVYVAGRFTHALRKRPKPGDFRVQPEYGGLNTPYAPQPDEFAAAERILAAIDEPLLYARIDIARDLSGAPALMELEAVEPDLYFEYDLAGGAAFVEAVREAASRVS